MPPLSYFAIPFVLLIASVPTRRHWVGRIVAVMAGAVGVGAAVTVFIVIQQGGSVQGVVAGFKGLFVGTLAGAGLGWFVSHPRGVARVLIVGGLLTLPWLFPAGHVAHTGGTKPPLTDEFGASGRSTSANTTLTEVLR